MKRQIFSTNGLAVPWCSLALLDDTEQSKDVHRAVGEMWFRLGSHLP
ncbi:hypothetical protein [Streptomyces sp. NBC_00354]|nr:hypothetical protein [Streptomyces sp. NBC_01443]